MGRHVYPRLSPCYEQNHSIRRRPVDMPVHKLADYLSESFQLRRSLELFGRGHLAHTVRLPCHHAYRRSQQNHHRQSRLASSAPAPHQAPPRPPRPGAPSRPAAPRGGRAWSARAVPRTGSPHPTTSVERPSCHGPAAPAWRDRAARLPRPKQRGRRIGVRRNGDRSGRCCGRTDSEAGLSSLYD